MASVPTGTPAGICAIDSRESIPFKFAFDRYAEHGQDSLRRTHPRQMGSTTGTGDDHFNAPVLGRLGKFEKQVGCAMGRNDLCLVLHTKLV